MRAHGACERVQSGGSRGRRRPAVPSGLLLLMLLEERGGGRQPSLRSSSDASAVGASLLLHLRVVLYHRVEVLGLGRLAHSGDVVVGAARRDPVAALAVPAAGHAACERRPTSWLLEARLGWLGVVHALEAAVLVTLPLPLGRVLLIARLGGVPPLVVPSVLLVVGVVLLLRLRRLVVRKMRLQGLGSGWRSCELHP